MPKYRMLYPSLAFVLLALSAAFTTPDDPETCNEQICVPSIPAGGNICRPATPTSDGKRPHCLPTTRGDSCAWDWCEEEPS